MPKMEVSDFFAFLHLAPGDGCINHQLFDVLPQSFSFPGIFRNSNPIEWTDR
jgi:hypothetical protein